MEPIFRHWAQLRDDLPTLTVWLMPLAQWNASGFYLPALLWTLVIVVVSDFAVVFLCEHPRTKQWGWVCVPLVGLAGWVACFLVLYAMCLPWFTYESVA